MATTICLAQSKGGSGKTSSVLNLGASLVKANYRVLLVDTDQQANLTASLGVDLDALQLSMRDLFIEPQVSAKDILIKTPEGLDLLPASTNLSMVEFKMNPVNRERQLAKKLHAISNEYDFCLIDTAPSFAIPTLNAMASANYLLVPVQPEPLCLLSMSQLDEVYNMVRNEINPRLNLLGLFITLYDSRVKLHREIAQKVRTDWGEQVLQTVIRRRSNILDSTLEGRSMVSFNANSEISQDYQKLTQEVLGRVQKAA